MDKAIALALRGRGRVEPNPRVGALALEGDRVVGRGWHDRYGGNHAEVAALADARSKGAKADSLIVTLEPCSLDKGSEGKKTPACTEQILNAGIRQLIYGEGDPDPRHAGKARQRLEAGGVQVTGGVSVEACTRINQPFRRWLGLDRPWTIAKYAMSLDGKIATHRGESRWISGEQSRAAAHALRGNVDGVVVGFRTAQMDDPELSLRLAEGRQPIRILIDPLAELDPAKKLIAQAGRIPTWILHRADLPAERRERLEAMAVVMIGVDPVGERSLDLVAAWRELRRRGLRRLMVEGGGRLLDALTRVDCLDQILAFVSARIIGSEKAPSPVSGEGFGDLAAAPRLGEMYWHASGQDLAIGAFFLPDD